MVVIASLGFFPQGVAISHIARFSISSETIYLEITYSTPPLGAPFEAPHFGAPTLGPTLCRVGFT
jgi:hypothetical protein